MKTYKTFRVPIKVVDAAEKLSKEYGFNLSTIVSILLEQWVKDTNRLYVMEKKYLEEDNIKQKKVTEADKEVS